VSDPGALGGLTSISLWTSATRFPALRAFYIDTLGLRPDSDRPQRVRFTWGVPPGDLRLILGVHDQVDGVSREPARIMFNLLVEDIRAAAARLQAAGVTFSRPPGPEGWGGWVATFADPDGNILQLLQPAREG
jgi:predicted enzyme related to lactoylglutathione lyase